MMRKNQKLRARAQDAFYHDHDPNAIITKANNLALICKAEASPVGLPVAVACPLFPLTRALGPVGFWPCVVVAGNSAVEVLRPEFP
jgi:hypothetical protein